MQEEEEKNYWRDFYKDKYKTSTINTQISNMNALLEMKDSVIKHQVIASNS
jgi:hypothetical protein